MTTNQDRMKGVQAYDATLEPERKCHEAALAAMLVGYKEACAKLHTEYEDAQRVVTASYERVVEKARATYRHAYMETKKGAK